MKRWLLMIWYCFVGYLLGALLLIGLLFWVGVIWRMPDVAAAAAEEAVAAARAAVTPAPKFQ